MSLVTQITITCDHCKDASIAFMQTTELNARLLARDENGWWCDSVGDICPDCRVSKAPETIEEDHPRFGNIRRLKYALHRRNDKAYQRGEVWQSVINLCNAEWRRNEPPSFQHSEYVGFIEIVYGKLAALCVMLGAYNYQVMNNGHTGYWDNGYTATRRGYPKDIEDLGTHELMLQYMRDFGLHEDEVGKKVHEVASRFRMIEDDDEWGSPRDAMADESVDDDYAEISSDWEKHWGEMLHEALMV